MDEVAQALADPIRREILRMVRVDGLTAGAIARSFEVSRPAVSRHLRVLREAGLVQDDVRGRARVYRLDPCALDEFEQFLRSLRAPAAAWQRSFDALETEVHRVRKRRRAERTARATASQRKKESA